MITGVFPGDSGSASVVFGSEWRLDRSYVGYPRNVARCENRNDLDTSYYDENYTKLLSYCTILAPWNVAFRTPNFLVNIYWKFMWNCICAGSVFCIILRQTRTVKDLYLPLHCGYNHSLVETANQYTRQASGYSFKHQPCRGKFGHKHQLDYIFLTNLFGEKELLFNIFVHAALTNRRFKHFGCSVRIDKAVKC